MIKIIEVVDKSVFGKDYCFQVGDKQEVMYLVSSSLDDRTDWMKAFEQGYEQKQVHVCTIILIHPYSLQ
jgi:hypothetical protein